MFYLVALIAILCAALIIWAIENHIGSPKEQEPTEWLPRKDLPPKGTPIKRIKHTPMGDVTETTYAGHLEDISPEFTYKGPSSKGLTVTADTSKAQRALNALNAAMGSRNNNIAKVAFAKNPNIRDCGELFHEMNIISKEQRRLKEIIEGTKAPTNQETK